MAAAQPWTEGEANDADVVEQTMPAEPVDEEAPADSESESESEGPDIALEANVADVVEQATDVGPRRLRRIPAGRSVENTRTERASPPPIAPCHIPAGGCPKQISAPIGSLIAASVPYGVSSPGIRISPPRDSTCLTVAATSSTVM